MTRREVLVEPAAPVQPGRAPPSGLIALVVGALGVVYGDLGTSPLYSIREAFEGQSHRLAVDRVNVMGAVSIIVWTLVLIIGIKYVLLVLRADNHGEGGILALTALVAPRETSATGRRVRGGILVLLGLFGTALLFGDGMITPAISVLSAVEGIELVSPGLDSAVVPISVAILIGLFAIQRFGTGAVGRLFGPVMVVWFATMARARRGQPRSLAGDRWGGQSGERRPLLHHQHHQRFLVDGIAVPRRHRRRSAVCRHGSLRPATDPVWLVRRRDAVVAAHVPRYRRLAAA